MRFTIIGVIGAWAGIVVLITQTIAAKNTAQRQLRAYLFLQTTDILEGSMLTPPSPARTNFPFVHASIKNSGQTPAYEIISWLQIAITGPSNENTLVLPLPMQRVSANNLGPASMFTKGLWFDRPLTAPEIADIATGARAIYAYGRIEYTDAFAVRRFTNFRLKYNGPFPPLPNSVFNFCESGNDLN
jgi:hypothetical protein